MRVAKFFLASVCSVLSIGFIGGCDRTVSSQKSETKNPDGTSTKHEDKVTQDSNGGVTHTHEESVNK